MSGGHPRTMKITNNPPPPSPPRSINRAGPGDGGGFPYPLPNLPLEGGGTEAFVSPSEKERNDFPPLQEEEHNGFLQGKENNDSPSLQGKKNNGFPPSQGEGKGGGGVRGENSILERYVVTYSFFGVGSLGGCFLSSLRFSV